MKERPEIRVFADKVLREICGPKRYEVRGD
jgi:hypothetical protein